MNSNILDKSYSFVNNKATLQNATLLSALFSFVSLLLTAFNVIPHIIFYLLGILTLLLVAISFLKRQNIISERDNLYDSHESLHDIVHYYRDSLSGNRISDLLLKYDYDEFQAHFNTLLDTLLNNAQVAIQRLCGCECVTNIMRCIETDNGKVLKTDLYSSNASVERKKGAKVLPYNMGLAWAAFNDGNHVYINNNFEDKDQCFAKAREDYSNFYNSGISAPINIDKKPCGVFNVDAREKDVFNEKIRHLVAIYADLASAILQMFAFCDNLKGNGGNHESEKCI